VRLLLVSLVLLWNLALPVGSLAGSEVGMKDGQAFPDLLLPSLETGKLERISSFRGRKTLLLVYASW
jgi:hypothetical protein